MLEVVTSSPLVQDLARVSFDREEDEIDVKVLADLSSFKIGDLELHLYANSEIRLQRWVARILEKHQLIKIIDRGEFDVPAISKHFMNEDNSREIASLPDHYYLNVKEYLESLDVSVSRVMTLKRERAHRLFRDLLVKRLRKIVLMAEKGKLISNAVNNLIEEERILFQQLNEEIEDWKSYLLE